MLPRSDTYCLSGFAACVNYSCRAANRHSFPLGGNYTHARKYSSAGCLPPLGTLYSLTTSLCKVTLIPSFCSKQPNYGSNCQSPTGRYGESTATSNLSVASNYVRPTFIYNLSAGPLSVAKVTRLVGVQILRFMHI